MPSLPRLTIFMPGTTLHGGHVPKLFVDCTVMSAANTNAGLVARDAPRIRLSAKEAMRLSALQFRETLAYLSKSD